MRCLRHCNSETFILLWEKRGHENKGNGTNSEAIGGPRHQQAEDGHIGAKDRWVEEAESQAPHGDSHRDVANDVDLLAVQF